MGNLNDPVVIAIDAGTGSARAIAFDQHGSAVARASQEWSHRPVAGHPGGTTFDTSNGWMSIAAVLRSVVADLEGRPIAAVVASSMREGFVLFDREDVPIFACPNTDGRGRAEARILAEDGRAAQIFDIAGDWVSITAPARLLWLQAHEPERLQSARHLGMLSDWVTWCLTGVHTTDPTCGSSSAMFDIAARRWSSEIAGAVGINPGILPEVVEGGTIVGSVTPEASAATGLPIGTPVTAGGADTQLALHGLGATTRAPTLVSGTFWQTALILDAPTIDAQRRLRTLCHVAPGEWMIEGIGFLSGLAFRWVRDVFYSELRGPDAYHRIDEEAGHVPAGSSGIMALLSNVMQSDGWRHTAPTFVGFDISDSPSSDRSAFARSVQEAAAYVTRAHVAILDEFGEGKGPGGRMVMTGGSSAGVSWPQIVADTLNRPLSLSPAPDATSLGAARLAADAVGMAIPAASCDDRVVTPDVAQARRYDELFDRWLTAYPAYHRASSDAGIQPLFTPPGGADYRPADVITPRLRKALAHG
ncbi:MAG: FGGY family carbohydrate kinase [Actinomycetota bacterium]